MFTFLNERDPGDCILIGTNDKLVKDLWLLVGVALKRQDDLGRGLDAEGDALRVLRQLVESQLRISLVIGESNIFCVKR